MRRQRWEDNRSGNNTAYVDSNGHLRRSDQGTKRFSYNRLLSVLVLVALFVCTNPANPTWEWLLRLGLPMPSLPKEWSSRWKLSRTHTNYGVFLLTRSSSGIQVTALLNTVQVCRFQADDFALGGGGIHDGEPCRWLERSMCHGKALVDWSDLPYMATRVLGMLVLVVITIKFCNGGVFFWPLRPVLILDFFLSVLDDDRPLWQFLRVHAIVHPALKAMNRLLARSFSESWQVEAHFVIGTVVLVFGIGAISNSLGTYASNQRVNGMDASVAAALGYLTASGTATAVWDLVGVSVSRKTLFWTELVLSLLQNRIGSVVAMVTGVLLGHGLGEWHVQWSFDHAFERARQAWNKFVYSFII